MKLIYVINTVVFLVLLGAIIYLGVNYSVVWGIILTLWFASGLYGTWFTIGWAGGEWIPLGIIVSFIGGVVWAYLCIDDCLSGALTYAIREKLHL